MSNKDLSSKLAKGMRRAKEPGAGSTAAPTPTPRTPGTPTAASHTAAQVAPQTRPRQSSGQRFAEQGDQAPPASLDRPWDNLHPKRIWPD